VPNQTRKTNPLLLASSILASSFKDDEMTCSVVAYAGAPIGSWDSDYTLALDAGSVDMTRVANGAGLFLDHDHTIESQVGVIEGASLNPGKGLEMQLRFGGHPEAARYFQGAKDGIYQNLSIGVIVLKKKDVTPEGATRRQFLATKWQPFELSLVGVPADPKARFLSLENAPEPEDETEVLGSAPDDPNKEAIMPTPAELTGQTAAPNPEVIAAAKKAERLRVAEINRIGASAKMPAEKITAAIDGEQTVEAFKAAVADFLIAKEPDTRVGSAAPTITRDEADTRRALMASALLGRMDPKAEVEAGNDFRAMSCLRMAEEGLVRAGLSVRGKTPNEIAIMAMQNTADFPSVLENSARKRLMTAYSYATPTYKIWAAPSTTPDFKTMSRPRLGETPAFLKVPEGAQITLGTMTESKETYAIATYGRGISFTRQMLINDDLGAFNSLIQAFGLQASIIENKTVYAILTANAAMADTVALFHATHANLGSGVIANAGLDAMFTAMGIQTGVDGASVLNLTPKFLIVPKAKEATANAALTAVGPNVKASDQNWFSGRLQVVADGVLDAASTTVWYGASDPGVYPGVEYAHLEGANGPQMIREENGSAILGVNIYAFLDFGAKAVDWRPLYKSSGA